MKIYVTQYMRPTGQPRTLHLEIPDEYEEKYKLIGQCGCRITCEQLMTGEAVQYISHKEGDYAIKITSCRSSADKALLQMLDEFDKQEFDKWLEEIESQTAPRR